MSDANYLVNVSCPHCKSHLLVAVSGFGSELATREKECKKCGLIFYVHILTSTSTSKEVQDGEISSAKSRIKYLQDLRKQSLAELLLRQETLQRIYQDSIVEAQQMRSKNNLN